MSESRFPVPDVLQPVTDAAERTRAAQIIELAERAIAAAEYRPVPPEDGGIFFHVGTVVQLAVDAADGAYRGEMSRTLWSRGEFAVIDNDGERVVSVDDAGVFEGDAPLQAAATAVDNGTKKGEHDITVIKSLDSMDEADSSVLLALNVCRTSDGQLFPVTTVDLHYFRSYGTDDGVSLVVQGARIASNPNSGELHSGSVLAAEHSVVEDLTEEGGPGIARRSRIADPFAEMTADALQSDAQPMTPTNVDLPLHTWQQLITDPISPYDKLR